MLTSVLYIFTNQYPYCKKDSPVLEHELKYLSSRFEKIIILPYLKNITETYTFPPNIEVVYLFETFTFSPRKILIKNFFTFLFIVLYEFIHTSSKKKFIQSFSDHKSLLLQALDRSAVLKTFLKRNNALKSYFYSYWFGEWAIVLSILKMQKTINHFISRAHGFDLYEERWPEGLIPFRSFQLRQANNILADSRAGAGYLKQRYPQHTAKIGYSYVGVEDSGGMILPENAIFTILSCSSIIPLKRVHLIAEALQFCKFPVKWIHIGDGPLKNDIEEKIRNVPRHTNVELKGHMSREQIYEFYKKNPVNLFVHTSETEGLPAVLMEASSAGIPLMACDVGGVSEIVNEETGILLPPEVSPEEIAEAITKFKEKIKNNPSIRLRVREYWEKNFNASVNYNRFADQILL